MKRYLLVIPAAVLVLAGCSSHSKAAHLTDAQKDAQYVALFRAVTPDAGTDDAAIATAGRENCAGGNPDLTIAMMVSDGNFTAAVARADVMGAIQIYCPTKK